jgi:preprotein translocase subunit SecD
MKIITYISLIATVIFILTECAARRDFIEVNKGKIGGLYEISENGKAHKFYNSDQLFKLDTLTFISFEHFDKIYREESEFKGVYSLGFILTESGKRGFEEMTARNIKKQLCFVLEDKVIAAPIVHTSIPNGRVSVTVADERAIDRIIEYLSN